jgi:hypothetical protein
MAEDKQDQHQDAETDDEMPEIGGAPCGDIFTTPGTIIVGEDATNDDQDG